MVTSNNCISHENLSAMLSGEEKGGVASSMLYHLETCTHCQKTLSELAADPIDWEDGRRFLSEPTFDDPDEGSHSVEATSPLVAQTLAHYDIEKMIGCGGMSTVFQGRDRSLDRLVAIKVLHPHLAKNGTSRQRFIREAQSAASIVHPNVVPIYGVHQLEGQSFLVMPLIMGGSLQQRVDRDGPLPLEDVLQIGLQISEALEAAHSQGVIHRDIKPANILLEDGNRRVLLSDFGLARTLDDVAITASGMISGTPSYMSPEQARGEIVDQRSDIYSLGCVLYAMCTGHAPFQANGTLKILRLVADSAFPSVHRYQEQLPSWVDTLIGKLVAKETHKRMATAKEASALIRDCLLHQRNSLSSTHHSVRDFPSGLKRELRHRRLHQGIKIGAVMLAVVALGLGVVALSQPRASVESPDSKAISTERGPGVSPKGALTTPGETPGPQTDTEWGFAELEAELESLENDLEAILQDPIFQIKTIR